MNEVVRVAVIGGGYAGIISALLLARCNSLPGQTKRYDITIHESKDSLLSSTSNSIARLHMGGEYPSDKQTAETCVLGAVLFAQVFQKKYFASEYIGADYCLTKAAEESGILTLEKIHSQYESNMQQYAKYYATEGMDTDALFGAPADFYRLLEDGETRELFSGGVSTNELGINSKVFNKYLLALISESKDIAVEYRSKIIKAECLDGIYRITNESGVSFESDIVLNASWESNYFLDVQVGKPQDRKAYLRMQCMIDISKCLQKGRSAFALSGPSGGMYSVVGDTSAIIYAPNDEMSYVRSAILDEHNTQVPDDWQSIPSEEIKMRSQNMLSHTQKLFPEIADATLIRSMVSPTFSFDDLLEKRRHISSCEIARNWISVFPTKATFAPLAALEMIAILEPGAMAGFDLKQHPVVPPFLRF